MDIPALLTIYPDLFRFARESERLAAAQAAASKSGPPSTYPFSRGQMTARDREIALLLW